MKRTMRLWAVIAWLTAWQMGSMALQSELLLVSPVRVLGCLARLSLEADFWRSIGFSLLRIAGGFLLASAAGILLAALSARFRRVEELAAPLIAAVKTIPVASFIILALFWFSARSLSVLISFLMALPIIYANVLIGIREMDRELLEMAQVFQIPLRRKVRYLCVPQVLPFFRAGCCAALGLCWKAGVAAEVIGIPRDSIGAHLQQAKVYLDMPALFAWTLAIVCVSLAFEKAFLYLLGRADDWLERM